MGFVTSARLICDACHLPMKNAKEYDHESDVMVKSVNLQGSLDVDVFDTQDSLQYYFTA